MEQQLSEYGRCRCQRIYAKQSSFPGSDLSSQNLISSFIQLHLKMR